MADEEGEQSSTADASLEGGSTPPGKVRPLSLRTRFQASFSLAAALEPSQEKACGRPGVNCGRGQPSPDATDHQEAQD